MRLRLYYKELVPTYESYQELLIKMKEMSKESELLDKIFRQDFNYKLMKQYEKKKLNLIQKMFKEILTYFPKLNDVSCAIYLSGSYARRSITSGSDMDLTFYFSKNDVYKYQSTIYLIRYAISIMFNVNVVHIHSFTKNFTTEYRKKNNLSIFDQELKTKIIWTLSNKHYDINYPKNQMIPEREICEISSVKNIDSLTEIYLKQINRFHPKEWIYTHECIHITDNSFSIEKIIKKLDSLYGSEERKLALNNIKREIYDLLKITREYYNQLEFYNEIDLASYNMLGKRKVTALVHSFATYLRWLYIDKGLDNIPLTLNLNVLFNYKNSLVNKKKIDNIKKSYCYFRYLISKIEILTKNNNHHFEHRSLEKIKKDVLNKEYRELWGEKYDPIHEQVKVFKRISKSIEELLI